MTDLYAAAVDAADVEPDLEATPDFPDAPLPLIEVVDDEGERKLRLVPETADVIAAIDAELCVVAMCGPHRSGKSSLLNWLRDPAGGRGFTVGHGTSRQTKGLDVWGRPADIETESGAPAALLLIDVEGMGGLGVDSNYDQTLFALAALLASSLVYNSPGALDENAIASLGLVSRLARKIEADEAGGNSDHLPDLWWVLRDFALELVNADGDDIDSDEYLESSLRRTNRRESDEYRAAIALAFERRRCATLPRPYEAECDLRADTDKAPRPAFAAALAELRRRLFSRPRPKKVRGAALRGKTFVALAATYVDAFNAGATPVVSSAWTAVVKAECDAAVDAGVAAHAAALEAVPDDASEAAFAAARLEGCRACDGIVAAASNDAVLRSSVGDRPLLDARRRCDHDFAEKLRRRRDRCRAALIRATTAVDKNLAPRLRATRGETQATCTPFDDATDAEQAAADAVAATAALQTACGPGDAGFLAQAGVRWAAENCRALMTRQDRARDVEAQRAGEEIASLRERVAFLEGEQVAMRDAAEQGRKAVASAQTDVQRLTSRCSALEVDVSRSRAAYANLASDAASTKEALADANAMLESEGKWQAQLQDRLDATIEEHLEAKRHLVARATRAEEAVSSYSKARRRYTILDLLLESTEDAAARLDASAKELEKFLVDLDVPVGALRILRDLGARSVSDLAFVEASDFDAAVDLTDVQKRRLIDAIDETKKRLAKKRASTNACAIS
jgi:hypothetical protein